MFGATTSRRVQALADELAATRAEQAGSTAAFERRLQELTARQEAAAVELNALREGFRGELESLRQATMRELERGREELARQGERIGSDAEALSATVRTIKDELARLTGWPDHQDGFGGQLRSAILKLERRLDQQADDLQGACAGLLDRVEALRRAPADRAN
jgi:chromosome segregation ATPase